MVATIAASSTDERSDPEPDVPTGSPTVKVTASLGVASRNTKEDYRLRELLALADESLYKAKRSGKNTTLIHEGNVQGP